ncbi:ComEA family DNA-binding protein [uncultured Kocuria sp.]|uniref:ComEA family DNA-binding protein n=1 Tax=uncultured Kocuria sp. TaxID=259305 RepID=UPI0025985D43|nr:ComEA family DNA-binding protein [uncultured Kocuria sp.]MCT1366778.1 ComEA family DNA-binding protein [Rothia sp. p3-SID1597]
MDDFLTDPEAHATDSHSVRRRATSRPRTGTAAGRERLNALMERSRTRLPSENEDALDALTKDRSQNGTLRASRNARNPSKRLLGLAPSPRATIALVAMVVVALVGSYVFLPRHGETANLAVETSGSTVPWESFESRFAGASGSSTAISEASMGEITVHVVGAVKRPGLVRLPPGALVNDAIEAVGGAIEGARLEDINLAEQVTSGQQIRVPRAGDDLPSPRDGQVSAHDASSSSHGKININTADVEELQKLPKVGPKLAERIIEWRTQHGPFRNLSELDAVPGIGPTMIAALEPLVSW